MIEQVKELDVEQVMVCSCEKAIQVEKLFQHCAPWFNALCIMCGQDWRTNYECSPAPHQILRVYYNYGITTGLAGLEEKLTN